MKKLYATDIVSSSTPEQVAKLLQLDQTTPEPWSPEDLPAMVRHQMSAPLEFDLGSVKLSQLEQKTITELLTGAAGSGVKTFGDLLRSDKPPLELLKLSQKFFKQNVTSTSKGSPEQKVAYLFYLLSIVAARIRLGVKTSKLSDKELLKGIQSIVSRSWINDQVRELLEDGQRWIAPESSR
jgi:hypothetical protein